MKKALVLIDEGFQDAEAIYPYYRLIEAGFETHLAGDFANHEYHGKKGYPLTSELSVENINVDNYDVVIIPGGYAPDSMRTKYDYVRVVKEAAQKGKVIGAICHAAQLLIEADVVKGKKLTCYEAVKTDVINAGGHFEDAEVIIDGKLITSRKPADLPAFMRAVIETAI